MEMCHASAPAATKHTAHGFRGYLICFNQITETLNSRVLVVPELVADTRYVGAGVPCGVLLTTDIMYADGLYLRPPEIQLNLARKCTTAHAPAIRCVCTNDDRNEL